MKRFLFALAALGLIFTGCTQVDPDTYPKLEGSTYGESNGWYTDSSDNALLYIADTKVLTVSSAGVLTTVSTTTSAGNLTVGAGVAATDYTITFDGESSDGVLQWMEDEKRLDVEGSVQFGAGAAGVDYTIGVDGETNDGLITYDEDNDLWTVADGLTVTGATVLNGGLAMDTNKFTVADTTGNTVIGGTALLSGNVTIGAAAAGVDYTLTFDGEDDDAVLTYDEDNNILNFGDTTITTTGALNAGVATITDLDTAVILQGDAPGTCTVGQWFLDTATTAELCYCQAANVL